jgi:AcrR family transcriptional regulator
LDALSLLAAVRVGFDRDELALLDAARAAGVTWESAGSALGYDAAGARQGASGRYRRLHARWPGFRSRTDRFGAAVDDGRPSAAEPLGSARSGARDLPTRVHAPASADPHLSDDRAAPDASRRLRADAARNSERILRAAREVYAERGPGAPLEEIARRAGVGIATLYRRFPSKGGLIRAALDQSVAEEISPAVEQALNDENPRRGLVTVLEAALSHTAREHNMLAAARHSGALTAEVSSRFFESQILLVRRAQQAGLLRADLVPDDVPRIMAMLFGVIWTMAPEGEGWLRYIALVLDALSPAAAHPLPPAVPLHMHQQESWPI